MCITIFHKIGCQVKNVFLLNSIFHSLHHLRGQNVMPFFICLNVVISFLVQTHHHLESLIMSVWSEYIGIASIIISWILMLTKKLNYSIRYDFFCSGAMLIWISTWPPFFNEDSPVIFFFPLFLCFMTILVNLLCIQQASKIDAFTLGYLNKFNRNFFFNAGFIMAGVLYSLTQPENYRLFPNVMAILILKFTLDSIVEQTDLKN